MTNKMKVYQLKNIKQCQFKAYISQFDFKTLNNKSNMIRQVYKSILQGYDFLSLNEDNLKQIITEKLEDTYFLTQQEKDVEINIILNYLLRYIKYENKNKYNRKIIGKKVYETVGLNDENNNEIEVKADIVFENANSIELVKYKTSATKLSYKARTEKNLPENDMELYLLKKLGEKLYTNHNKLIISSYYHLKGKNEDSEILKQFLSDKSVLYSELAKLEGLTFTDKKAKKENDKAIKNIKDVLYFDNSEGNNVITFDYDKNLSDTVIKLANTELSKDSEKCKSADCEFCSYSTLCNYNKDAKNELQIVKEVEKASGEVKLTEAQKQVINIEEGNYRINAVAGSGKSTTMVMRVIELLKKGYSVNDILMITFTNKGCEELKDKISYWLKHYNIKGINKTSLNIFTFNSFGENIISNKWKRLGFTKQPELASLIDIIDIIKDLLKEYNDIEWLNYKNPLLNYPNAKGAFKQLLIYFDLIKSFNYNKNSFITKALNTDSFDIKGINKADIIFEIYDKFNQLLKEKNLLQYQDQILYTIELFEKFPELINRYGYKQIIVDEYQDTDFAQVKVLHLLRDYEQCKSLIVVGDSSQAIYGFRNTTPENIINFHKEFDNVKDIFLLDNFRSTPEICNVANKLDKINKNRIDKDIISKKENGVLPQLLQFKTLDEEYNNITDLIEESIKNDITKHEICVIARTKKELLEIQNYLNNKNIPNIIKASELYLDNTYVQTIINLANFFKNNEYNYYLMEYLNIINNDFIKEKDMNIIKEKVENLKNKLVEEFSVIEDEQEKIKYFYSLIEPIINLDVIAHDFIEGINGKVFFTFNEFLNYLYKFMLYQDNTSIEKDENKYDAVVLTTAHSSKGKEWKIVINTIDKYKYSDIINNETLLEEERRLLFVSITRAKNELYITYIQAKIKQETKENTVYLLMS